MTFRFSGPLLRFVAYEREVQLQAADLRGALAALLERHGPLRPVLLSADGAVRATHRLFVNGQSIEANDNPAMKDDDVVDLITAIAGGSACAAP